MEEKSLPLHQEMPLKTYPQEEPLCHKYTLRIRMRGHGKQRTPLLQGPLDTCEQRQLAITAPFHKDSTWNSFALTVCKTVCPYAKTLTDHFWMLQTNIKIKQNLTTFWTDSAINMVAASRIHPLEPLHCWNSVHPGLPRTINFKVFWPNVARRPGT